MLVTDTLLESAEGRRIAVEIKCNKSLQKYGTRICSQDYDNVVCVTSKDSDQPGHMRSLIKAFVSRLEYSMNIKLLNEHHLEFLSLKVGCTGLSESTLVKIPHR